MTQPIISVEGLGKRYHLSHKKRHDTLRDSLAHSVRGFFKSDSSSISSAREEFWALRDVSFQINQGDVVGIIGRNGAGKSTLLKILSRITEPTKGRAVIRGRVASLLEVGTGFHPELSGRENIFLNGAILGMSRAEITRKFDEIVAFAEVERFLDTQVKHYSSGMYVRLAFAVAAHLEPEILIVDEVLAVGDAQFQKKCMGKMKSVASSEGRTILFVSHQAEAVRALCTRCLWMGQGQLIRDGTPDEIIAAYLETSAGENFLTVTGLSGSRLLNADIIIRKDGILFTAEFSTDVPLVEPKVGLVIKDADQRPVFGSNTQMHPLAAAPTRSLRHRVTLRVPVLPVHAGRYQVAFYLGDRNEHLLSVEPVAYFEWSPSLTVLHRPPVRDIGPLNIAAAWELTPL